MARGRERRLHALADAGVWYPLTRLARHETGSLQDLPRSGIALLTTGRSLIAIRGHGRGADARFSAEHLPVDDNRPGRGYWRSTLFGELLHIDGGGWFSGREGWRRLTPAGFEDIPGGEIGLIAGDRGHAPRFSTTDVSWLGVVLLGGEEGLDLYDGREIRPLPDGRRDELHGRGFPRALPTIRQVLVAAPAGMFRLADEMRLEPWSPPAKMTSVFDSFDRPEARVTLLKTAEGLYALDSQLGTEKVTDVTGFAALDVMDATRDPGTGELVLSAREGLFLVVDSRHPGVDGCQCR